MRTPRLAVAAAAVLIAVAGCGQAADAEGGGSPRFVTSVPTDPVERVNAAARKLNENSFKFTIESAGVKADGVRHQPSDSTQVKMTGAAEGQEFTVELIKIGKDMWMKLDFGFDGSEDPAMKELAKSLGGWNHVTEDEAESSVGGLATNGADALGADMVKGASSIKETAPGTFTGTIDVGANTGLDVTDEDTIKALGDKAKTVPITITLDSEERVSSLVLDIPAAGKAKAQKATIKFFDFGDVTPPKAPPADEVKEK